MDNADHTALTSKRLNKFVALALGVSRREADELIERGDIHVNGKRAALGQRVSPEDHVTKNGRPISAQPHVLLMLHKPVGYVCSRRAQGDAPTIYALLPPEYSALKSVGRLDKNSSGLLLLTNDGQLAHQMTHPSFQKIKRYLITLDKNLAPLHRQMIQDFGVQLDDGKSQFQVERQHDNDEKRWIITMSEGRNRQIRRTFYALGYTVTKLHRVQFGAYSLDGLARGKWKII